MYQAKSLGGAASRCSTPPSDGRSCSARQRSRCCSRRWTTAGSSPTTSRSIDLASGRHRRVRGARPDRRERRIHPAAARRSSPSPRTAGWSCRSARRCWRWPARRRAAGRTDGAGDRPLTIAVNLSARQFEPGDLRDRRRSHAGRHGPRPGCAAPRADRDRDHRSAPRHPATARAASATSACRSGSTTSAPATHR